MLFARDFYQKETKKIGIDFDLVVKTRSLKLDTLI